MDRRRFLRGTGLAAGLTIPFAGGCLGSAGSLVGPGTRPTWEHPVGGRVATVANDAVFGIEDFQDEGADGGVFSLDAETADHAWTYGETNGYDTYTTPTIADAVYVGHGDDAVGSGTGACFALEFDGSVRWTGGTGSVYSPPLVRDDAVYVGSDDGVTRAFDAASGDLVWDVDHADDDHGTPDGPIDVTVAAVGDVVYVAARDLVALDPTDGRERWRYEVPEYEIRDATVEDGVAYVTPGGDVAAVADGEERWRRSLESTARIRGVTSDHVVVERRFDLLVLDAATGESVWSLPAEDRLALALGDETVYVGDDRVRALDVGDGSERWVTEVEGDERVESVTPAGDESTADGSVVVHSGPDRLHRIDAEGTEAWTASVPGRVRSVAVTDSVFVGSDDGVFAYSLA